VRQLLDQEHHKYLLQAEVNARQARFRGSHSEKETSTVEAIGAKKQAILDGVKVFDLETEIQIKKPNVKKDFFGRIVKEVRHQDSENGKGTSKQMLEKEKDGVKIWVTYNEGFSNAVRKPITLKELMEGL